MPPLYTHALFRPLLLCIALTYLTRILLVAPRLAELGDALHPMSRLGVDCCLFRHRTSLSRHYVDPVRRGRHHAGYAYHDAYLLLDKGSGTLLMVSRISSLCLSILSIFSISNVHIDV